MQIKTIKKTIENKLNEWIETIEEKSLKIKVKDNILVSGGAIASMLLNQPVNDYDIYMKDQGVLEELVQYYTKFYGNIIVLNGKRKEELIKSLEGAEKGIVAISTMNLKADQVKLMFTDKHGGMLVNDDKDKEAIKSQYIPLYFSPNAISLSGNIQIVLRFSGDSKAIHEKYDFVHATNYFTFKDGLVTNKEALESLLTLQLKYQGSLYPLTSILRMKKFVKRGWNINAGEILKIMFQISELDLHDQNVLEDQLIGIDVAYFSKVIEILRDVKDEKITSKYLNTIIDRVFSQASESEEII